MSLPSPSLPPLSQAKLRPNGSMLPPFPHMRPEECELVERHLLPHHTVLEWGSGYSTLRFSQLVNEYFSIEHDLEWYQRIKPQIATLPRDNIYYYHVKGIRLPDGKERKKPGYKPHKFHRPAESWAELDGSLRDKQFYNYIRAADLINNVFDIVIIDGRARCECAKHAIRHLAPNHLVFFHNWDRPIYHIILKKYTVIERVKSMAMLWLKDQ